MVQKKIACVLITLFCVFLTYFSGTILYGQTVDGPSSTWSGFEYLCPHPSDAGLLDRFLSPALNGTEQFATDDIEVTYAGSAMWTGDRDIVYRDNFVYRTMGNGLMILDVSDPTNPQLASRAYLERGWGTGVAVYENYAYVTGRGSTVDGAPRGAMHIIDITSPSNPIVLSTLLAGTEEFGIRDAYSVTAIEDWAYVGVRGGLLVVDVRDPASPQISDTDSIGSTAYSLLVQGNYLYAAAGVKVVIYDISDPSNPARVAELATPGFAVDIDAYGNTLVICDRSVWWPAYMSSVQLADISDPAYPVLGASYDVPGATHEVAVDSNFAYLGGSQGVNVFEIEGPDSLVARGYYPAPGRCVGLAASGNWVYVSSYNEIYGDEPPLGPCDACFCPGPDDTTVIYPGDFQVLDVTDKDSPCAVGLFRKKMYVTDLAISGGYVYTISTEAYDNCLGVVDASNPDTLIDANILPIGTRAVDICALNDFLYLAAGSSGLWIYDLADPVNPVHLSALDLASSAWSICVTGNLAYVTCFMVGLQIVDVSRPAVPVVLGTYDTPGAAYDVDVEGDFAYVADGSGGLIILDISDPHSPVFVANYGQEEDIPVSWVTVRDGVAYIDEGLIATIDVSNPANPRLLGKVDEASPDHPPVARTQVPTVASVGAGSDGIFVAWDQMLAVACVGMEGVYLIDVADPQDMSVCGWFDTPCIAKSTVTDSTYIWLADFSSVMRWKLPTSTDADEPQQPTELPTSVCLYQNSPNPFNPTTEISFALPSACFVRLDVFNVVGQRITTLVDREMKAGHHRVSFDGSQVASGVYFYRLTAGDFVESKKMMLVK